MRTFVYLGLSKSAMPCDIAFKLHCLQRLVHGKDYNLISFVSNTYFDASTRLFTFSAHAQWVFSFQIGGWGKHSGCLMQRICNNEIDYEPRDSCIWSCYVTNPFRNIHSLYDFILIFTWLDIGINSIIWIAKYFYANRSPELRYLFTTLRCNACIFDIYAPSWVQNINPFYIWYSNTNRKKMKYILKLSLIHLEHLISTKDG